MASLNVPLPDPMKDWVEAQARTGRYSNASDYVRDLIWKDQERAAKIVHLRQLVTDALESGVEQAARREAEVARGHLRDFGRVSHFARERREISRSVRVYPCGSHVIVYLAEADGGVLILRVRHGREGLDQ